MVAVVLPIAASAGSFMLKQWRLIFGALSVGALLSAAVIILSGAPLGEMALFPSMLFSFDFAGHTYSRIAVFGFALVGGLAVLYGLQGARTIEQAAALTAVASAIAISLANDFITLFLFWELLTVSVAGLILLNSDQSRTAYSQGMRVLIFHLVGGLLVLFGILEHSMATGSFLLTPPQAGHVFFALGFGFKAAFLPFHLWVAWGYPSASLFSSVVLAGLTTKIGVYALARILPAHDWIVLMGASMALFGVVCALLQKNMRRLLSYHIISQVGYMVAGVGLGTALSMDGGLLHVVNHMLYKALLFMSAGAVLYAVGTEDVHDLTHPEADDPSDTQPLRPVWKALPLATIGAFVGAFAISGVPLFNGYVSKYLLKEAFYGVQPAEAMLMIASIGTAASFSKFLFFGFIKAKTRRFRKPLLSMHIAIAAVAVLCVVLGIRPQWIHSVLPYGSSLEVYSWGGAGAALRLAVIGVAVFAVLARPLDRGIPVPKWMSIEWLVLMPLQALFSRVAAAISARGTNLETHLDFSSLLVAVLFAVILAVFLTSFFLGF